MIQRLLRRLLPALLLALAVPVILSSSAALAQQGPQTGLQEDTLVVETAGGSRHKFTVELALTLQQQARGLMYREHMDDDRGMLFLYEVEQPLSFWMMNTLIPLDIIFIDEKGVIINIQHGKPRNTTPLPSSRPALAVLELNGGLCARLGIRAGDRLLHPAFGVKRPG